MGLDIFNGKPTIGIATWKEYSDSIFYKLLCDCGGHDWVLLVEYDKNLGFTTLHIFGDVDIAGYWAAEKWYQKLWFRLRNAFAVLMTGTIKMEAELILQEKGQVESLIAALQYALDCKNSEKTAKDLDAVADFKQGSIFSNKEAK